MAIDERANNERTTNPNIIHINIMKIDKAVDKYFIKRKAKSPNKINNKKS
jgi:hypothetical protein